MPCGICGTAGHNARTCQSIQPDFIPVGYWREDENGDAQPWYAEDPDAEFDEFLKLMDPNLNFESHMMKKLLEDEIESEKRECIICYETVENEKVSIQCGHTYCVGCFVKHMRMSNECAYCRAVLCEVPQSKRTMTRETRTHIVETALMSSNGWLPKTLLDDFKKQTQEAVLQLSLSKHNTRSSEEMNRIINEAIESVSVTFSSYLIGIHTSNYISEWYES